MAARANISQWSIGGDFGEPAGTPSSHRGGRRHEMREPQQQPNVGIVPGVGGAPPRPAGVSSNRSNLGNGDIIGHSPNQSHGNLQPWRGSSRASTSSSPQHQGGYAQQHRSDLPPKHGSYQQQTAVHKHPNNSIPIYSQNRGPSTNEADADDYFMRYSSRHQQHGAPGLQLGAELPRGAASFYSNSVSSSVREEIYEQRRQLYYSGRRLQPPPQLPNTPQGQGLPPRPVQPAQSQPAAHTGHESSQEGNSRRSTFLLSCICFVLLYHSGMSSSSCRAEFSSGKYQERSSESGSLGKKKAGIYPEETTTAKRWI